MDLAFFERFRWLKRARQAEQLNSQFGTLLQEYEAEAERRREIWQAADAVDRHVEDRIKTALSLDGLPGPMAYERALVGGAFVQCAAYLAQQSKEHPDCFHLTPGADALLALAKYLPPVEPVGQAVDSIFRG
mgnify:CR=1 FL=1